MRIFTRTRQNWAHWLLMVGLGLSLSACALNDVTTTPSATSSATTQPSATAISTLTATSAVTITTPSPTLNLRAVTPGGTPPPLPPTWTPTFTPTITLTPSITFTPSSTPTLTPVPEQALCEDFRFAALAPSGIIYEAGDRIRFDIGNSFPRTLFGFIAIHQATGEELSFVVEGGQDYRLMLEPERFPLPGLYDWTVALLTVDERSGEEFCAQTGRFLIAPTPTPAVTPEP